MIDAYDENNRFGLLTIRAQQNEVVVFEDTLKLILPILFTYPSFIYTIEDDNTPNRHIHIFLQNDSKAKELDCSKVFQKFNKVKNNLKGYIKLKQTQEKPFWDERMVKNGQIDKYTKEFIPDPHDFFYTIGYIQKDTLCSRRRVKNITSEVLTQGVNYYATHMKIDKSCKKTDWTSIKPQNIYSMVPYLCEKHDIDLNDSLICAKLNKFQVGFNQITPQQLKLSLSELRLNKNSCDHKSLDDLTTHQNGGKIDVAEVQQLKDRIEDLMNHNGKMLQIIRDHQLDCDIPAYIQNLYINQT